MNEKQCTKCGRVKPAAEFWKNRRNPDGFDRWCRDCKSNGGHALPNRRGTFTPNRHRVEGGIAYIELTDRQGRPRAEAMVSPDDLARVLARGRWCLHQGPRRPTPYAAVQWREDGRGRLLRLHRFLLDPPEGMMGDHINGDGLDNRRENLRIATPGENTANRHRTNARSGTPGIHWDKGWRRVGGWRVAVKGHPMRTFPTLEEARDHLATIKAAGNGSGGKEEHGES